MKRPAPGRRVLREMRCESSSAPNGSLWVSSLPEHQVVVDDHQVRVRLGRVDDAVLERSAVLRRHDADLRRAGQDPGQHARGAAGQVDGHADRGGQVGRKGRDEALEGVDAAR